MGFFMVKLEIELTDEQFEKLEILKGNDVDAGKAIDLLFAIQDEALSQVEVQKQEENLLDKISDSGFDSKIKQELLKKNFGESETYDRKVQDAKHNVKWSEFFNF